MREVEKFLKEVNTELHRLATQEANAYWMYATTSEEKWGKVFQESAIEEKKYLSDVERFKKTNEYLKNERNSFLKRQLLLLKNTMTENQLPKDMLERMVKLTIKLEGIFNSFRGEMNGKRVSDNDILEVLKNSRSDSERRAAWEASKQIGEEVADSLIELVKLRNESARKLGYKNYHAMSFELQELDRDFVFSTFKELVKLTDKSYRKLKEKLDEKLSKRFRVDKIMPWHYSDPFFQEAPQMGISLDAYFKDADILKLTKKTYNMLDLDIDPIIDKSDFYERPGKNQHAFTINMYKDDDVRILMNLRPVESWMETSLHEFGHGVYDLYIDKDLPFLLRRPSHIFTTEAVAMYHGRLTKDELWIKKVLGLPQKEIRKNSDLKELTALHMLISARWIITLSFFERELYESPKSDLNSLWWKFVKDIQFVNPPVERNKPDWAAKIHLSTNPVYYQNYLLGELMASQIHHTVKNKFGNDILVKEVGDFFKKKIFKPGCTIRWDELLKASTGESINPMYFVEQFAK